MLKYIFIFVMLLYSFNTEASVPDTISLKEVVVTEKLMQYKKYSGLKIHKIDALVLNGLSNVSLSEVLSENTSVFIKTYGRGSLSTVSFRGTSASHTKVLWNNIEINSPMLGMVDFSLIPTWFIDDVQLSFGAASIKNSSGALGGSIDLSNNADWNKGISVHSLSTLGSYSTYGQFLTLNFSNSLFSSKTKMFYKSSANDFEFYNRDIPRSVDLSSGDISYNIVKQKNAEYKKYGLLQELYYKASMSDIISTKIWTQYSDRSIPQLSSNEVFDDDLRFATSNYNKQIDISTRLSSDWKHYFSNSNINLNLAYINSKLDYFVDIHQYTKHKISKNRSIDSQSRIETHSAKLEYNGLIHTNTSYKINVDLINNKVKSDEKVKHNYYCESQSKQNISLFVNHNWSPALVHSLSIRQPLINYSPKQLVGFTALEYSVGNKKQFKISANISTNNNIPSLNDLYYQPGGNPDLLSEHSVSYEQNMSYVLSANNFNLYVSSSVYHSEIDNWIVWLPNKRGGFWEPFNIKKVSVDGIELKSKIRGSIYSKLKYSIQNNYSITKSINRGDGRSLGDKSIGKQLPFTPVYSANALFNIEYGNYFINYNFSYYSERFTTSSNTRIEDSSVRDYLYPYYMSNISFAYKFIYANKCFVQIKLKIDNLLNEDYRSILQRAMPRRNYTLLLDIKF